MNIYINDPQQPAKACVIWMHGLGADAQDMAGLAQQLPLSTPVRHVFLNAPIRPVTLNNGMSMRAWYDIVGMRLTDREDREGILSSDAMIRDVIANQLTNGFTAKQIFLAGFSQGGAMALFSGLRLPMPIAGIIALSTYLPLASECNPVADRDTPVFIAHGQDDPIVLPVWTRQSIDWLRAHDFYQISIHEYPMEHSICLEEINDLAQWLTLRIEAFTTHQGDQR